MTCEGDPLRREALVGTIAEASGTVAFGAAARPSTAAWIPPASSALVEREAGVYAIAELKGEDKARACAPILRMLR